MNTSEDDLVGFTEVALSLISLEASVCSIAVPLRKTSQSFSLNRHPIWVWYT